MSQTTQGRLTLAAAGAAQLCAVTLMPLISGFSWLLAVFIVTSIMAGAGAATRQLVRWWPATVVVQLITLIMVLTTLFARPVALGGVLPGPAVLDAFVLLLRNGMQISREASPPVTAVSGVIFMVAGGMGLIYLLVDLIAVSLRRPAVAGLPLLAVYCIPAAVLTGGLSWFYFVAAGAGFLLLVSADAGDRIHSWGHVLGAANADNLPDRLLGGPLRGARRVGVSCLACAVVLPMAVPGLGGRLLNPGEGSGGPGNGRGSTISVINPILDVRKNLTTASDTPVIQMRSTDTTISTIRIVTDDNFEGTQWTPSVISLPRDQQVQQGLGPPPGQRPGVLAVPQQSTIKIGNLKETYLPLPYPATKVAIDGPWLWDSQTLNVIGDRVNTANISYTVDHLAVKPTAEQLRAAPTAPREFPGIYTALPAKMPALIGEVADRVAAGAATQYDQALALQQYLRSDGGFRYDETVLPPKGKSDSGQDAVAAFLENKQGYCVQFASAMTVMARYLKIPARVAVGFLLPPVGPDGTYDIRLKDAHAWPELYFDGVGWVRFEPTPGSRARVLPSWLSPVTSGPTTPSPGAGSTAKAPSAKAKPRPEPSARPVAAAASPALPTRVWRAIPWRVVAVLAMVLLLLALPMLSLWVSRRSRWKRARGAAEQAELSWEELQQQLGDLGVRWVSSWTPRAAQSRLIRDCRLPEPACAALSRLVNDIERARYAPPDRPGRWVIEQRDDVQVVTAAVACTVERSRRRRARWFPSSGVALLAGAWRRADVAADEAGRRAADLGADVRRTMTSGRR